MPPDNALRAYLDDVVGTTPCETCGADKGRPCLFAPDQAIAWDLRPSQHVHIARKVAYADVQRERIAFGRSSWIGTYLLDDHTPVPVPTLAWAMWFEHAPDHERLVKQTTIGDFLVSTAFMGFDNRITLNCRVGAPHLFDTAVFDATGARVDTIGHVSVGVWSSTWEAAERAHERTCGLISDVVRMQGESTR